MSQLLHMLRLIRLYRRHGDLSGEQLRAVQRQRLRRLVEHARQHSPWYRARLAQLDLDDLRLEELPILDKRTMMERFDEIVCRPELRRSEIEAFIQDPVNDGKIYKGHVLIRTSGTSGRQAVVAYDRQAFDHVRAVNLARGSMVDASPLRVLQRALMPSPLKFACVLLEGGFHPSFANFLHQPAASRWFIDVERISLREPTERIVERLQRCQPQVLFAYPSVLELLCHEVAAGRLDILKHPRAKVVSLSEPLPASLRERVQRRFAVPVFDLYGAGECLPIARSCAHSTGLHINLDMVCFEVVDQSGRPVPDGEYGRKVLVTNLFNLAQPLIRYELNDVAAVTHEPCPCGSVLPRILSIKGRSDELLWLAQSGGGLRALHPYYLLEAAQKFDAVLDWRVEQLAAQHLRLDLVLAPGTDLSGQTVARAFLDEIEALAPAGSVRLELRLVPRIAPDAQSGKVKRVSSRITPPDGAG